MKWNFLLHTHHISIIAVIQTKLDPGSRLLELESIMGSSCPQHRLKLIVRYLFTRIK